MSILIAHPGTQHTHHLVSGLITRGREITYSTSMVFGRGSQSIWKNLLPSSVYQKREISSIADNIIDRHSLVEVMPRLLKLFGFREDEAYATRNRIFQRSISDELISSSKAVIGFDTSSLLLAKRARKKGVPFLLELTTPHFREKEKWAKFISDNYHEWPVELLEKFDSLIRREEEEVETADVVVAPSAYVGRSHKTNKKILINPFGADVAEFKPKVSYRSSSPVFIFLGGINAPKGVPVLLDAWDRLKPNAELIIAGPGEVPRGVALPKGVRITGRIAKQDRQNFYHSGDVLICPSLYEGLAIVQLEAAACGLSVIGTHNSGGSEFLEEGSEGFFTTPGDAAELADKIRFFVDNPTACEQMGRRAAVKAQMFTWNAYVDRWLSIIDSAISNRSRS